MSCFDISLRPRHVEKPAGYPASSSFVRNAVSSDKSYDCPCLRYSLHEGAAAADVMGPFTMSHAVLLHDLYTPSQELLTAWFLVLRSAVQITSTNLTSKLTGDKDLY